MQAMEVKGKEIFKKKNTLQLERQKLLGLLESVVLQSLQPTPSDADLDFSMIEMIWNDWDKKRREQLVDLEHKASLSSNIRPLSGDTDLLGLDELPPVPLSTTSDDQTTSKVRFLLSNIFLF